MNFNIASGLNDLFALGWEEGLGGGGKGMGMKF